MKAKIKYANRIIGHLEITLAEKDLVKYEFLSQTWRDWEILAITSALRMAGSINGASCLLQIPPARLKRKMKKYNLQMPPEKESAQLFPDLI